MRSRDACFADDKCGPHRVGGRCKESLYLTLAGERSIVGPRTLGAFDSLKTWVDHAERG
jgi:hypothetical protein